MYSPLEQFQIIPIIKLFFIFLTNSIIILLLLSIYLFIFIKILNKFIPNIYQQIFESIYNIVIELVYSNIGSQKGKDFIPLIFTIFFFIIML